MKNIVSLRNCSVLLALCLVSAPLMAEGQADRMNELMTHDKDAGAQIDKIRMQYGPTSAGAKNYQMVGKTQMSAKRDEPVSFQERFFLDQDDGRKRTHQYYLDQ